MFKTKDEFKEWCEKQGMEVGSVMTYREGFLMRAYLAQTFFFGKERVVIAEWRTNEGRVRLIGIEPPIRRYMACKSFRHAERTRFNVETTVGQINLG